MSKFDTLSSNNKFEEIRKTLQKQREEAEAKKNGGGFVRDDSWKFLATLLPKTTKTSYLLRVLPNVHDKEALYPWISAMVHMFRRPDGKFIYTLCPTTFDKVAPCPICEKAKQLFATKDKTDEDAARKLYKKERHFMNIFIKEDPRGADENQAGKVVVFEFGKKLFDKVSDAVIDQGIDIVNAFNGHDFSLILKKQGEHTNYDSSLFVAKESALHEDEKELDKIFDSIHNLKEKVIGKGAQSYEKLLEMLTGKKADGSPADKPKTSTTSDSANGGKKIVEKESEGVVPDEKEVDEPKVAKTTVKKEEKKTSPKVEEKEESTEKGEKSDEDFDFDFGDN